jgi:hypothetical protein
MLIGKVNLTRGYGISLVITCIYPDRADAIELAGQLASMHTRVCPVIPNYSFRTSISNLAVRQRSCQRQRQQRKSDIMTFAAPSTMKLVLH